MLKIGLDHIEDIKNLGTGKKVGLITNHTGLNSNFVSNITIFKSLFQNSFLKIFTPEHGLYGAVQAGADIRSYYDNDIKMKIVSLYGNDNKDIDPDSSMRKNDTSYLKKSMPFDELNDIDIIFFDIQDIGTRIYTYISTMILSMNKCSKMDKEFVILDRPNPIGRSIEGPILMSSFRSFIGITEIPLRHGMTVGEIGNFYNDFFLNSSLNLKVIKMDNWDKNYYNYMPWIMPSPNMPTLNSAIVYPGQVMFEGLNISEGRGTTKPFEIIASPWINSYKLAREMNSLNLDGIKFVEIKLVPQFSKYKCELCNGVYLCITDFNKYKPYYTSLKLIEKLLELSHNDIIFYDKYFDMVNGTDKVRKALIEGKNIDELIGNIEISINRFKDKISNILLY